jgi:sarcosine oxidase subunit gamma
VIESSLYRSPFQGHKTDARPNRAGQLGVQLRTSLIRSLTLVTTWPDGTAGLEHALGSALGQFLPERTGHCTALAGGFIMRTGPQEFMLVLEQPGDMVTRLRQAIAAEVGSVTDLSHARCRVHMQGERCLDALSKLFALDLRETSFPIGEIRLSGHHHVPCTLHRLGPQQFDLYLFSTYAYDQLGTLIDAALEYGVHLEV